MGQDKLIVRGAREHNLKNVDLELPRDKLIVVTGLSGSGKSSLAFDTIYAEGQRRYVESLSAYARQFLGLMEKPRGSWSQPLLHFGRVPMFFYLTHIYLIHLIVSFAMVIVGVDWRESVITDGIRNFHPEGFGFSLGVVYLVWIAVILMLYPLCKWYDRYKTNHKEKWWLSYL